MHVSVSSKTNLHDYLYKLTLSSKMKLQSLSIILISPIETWVFLEFRDIYGASQQCIIALIS